MKGQVVKTVKPATKEQWKAVAEAFGGFDNPPKKETKNKTKSNKKVK
jgi:hypothetical protein